jgi:hypothetical protein
VNTKGKKGEPMTADDISRRIEELKAHVRQLDVEQYRLAAMSVEDPKVEADYQKNISDSVEAQREIERLSAALIGLDRRAQAAAATDRTIARHGQLGEFEGAVRGRLAALEEVADGIKVATTGYAKFLAASDIMERLTPPGASLPMPTSQSIEVTAGAPPLPCGPAIAIAAEMHRAAGNPRLALPGAHAPNLQTTDLPGDIEPLVESARRQAEAILAAVRDHVARQDASDQQKLEAA